MSTNDLIERAPTLGQTLGLRRPQNPMGFEGVRGEKNCGIVCWSGKRAASESELGKRVQCSIAGAALSRRKECSALVRVTS